MMARITDQLLADCLDEVLSGRQTAEECLAAHLGIADELRPLLAITESLAYPATAEPDPNFRLRGRLMLAEALAAEKAPAAPHSFRGGWTALFGNWGKAQWTSARMATAAV